MGNIINRLLNIFKKNDNKKNVVSIIKITHKSGEKIKIIISGNTPDIISYISNKIKKSFDDDSKWRTDNKIFEHTEKIWKKVDEVWDETDKVFNDINKKL